jgi:uncharacterized membrane protein
VDPHRVERVAGGHGLWYGVGGLAARNTMSLALYLLAGLCWVPVVWIQIRMARLAEAAASNGLELPATYHALARRWGVTPRDTAADYRPNSLSPG